MSLDEQVAEVVGVPGQYSTSWTLTGPLIEKHGITLLKDYAPAPVEDWQAIYRACDDIQFGGDHYATGPTPIVAACRLLLALKEAGKI